jgi:chromosome segregation ATPase
VAATIDACHDIGGIDGRSGLSEASFMIEPIMYFGLGALAAALIGLVIIPFVHARAVRLTTRRLEAATPLSMAEIQADKDQLRAEFAMSTRRLEMSVDQLKTKTTGQLAELGKKTDSINRLKMELGEKTATIFALEAREKALRDQLRSTEEELSIKTNALREAERSLADRQSELSKLTGTFDEQSVTAAGQRIEIVALKTQVDNLTDQVAGLQRDVTATEGRLAQERQDAETATKMLGDERGKVENLANRIAQLEQQLAQQTAEAEALSRRVAELEARTGEQGRQLADRERERDQLRLELEAARRIETDLRGELSSLDRRHDAATESLRAEKSVLEGQIDRAREDRAKLQRELAAMKREAESTWASERVENALLRERINDVAAEVARLTSALEGPGSPIETILAEAVAPRMQADMNGTSAGDKAATIAGMEDTKGSLADRIRALQTRASRLSSAT